MTLGERIAAQRTELHLSQSELAEKLEVSRQSVSKWETDTSVPELDKLVKLCDLFALSMDQLVRGEEGVRPDRPPDRGDRGGEEVHTGPPMRMIVGIVLLALAALAFLMTLLIWGSPLISLVMPVPLLVPGVLCLVLKRPGLWCAWAVCAMVDAYFYFGTGVNWSWFLYLGSGGPGLVHILIAGAMLAWRLVMIWATARHFREGQLWTRGRLLLLAAACLLAHTPIWSLGLWQYKVCRIAVSGLKLGLVSGLAVQLARYLRQRKLDQA